MYIIVYYCILLYITVYYCILFYIIYIIVYYFITEILDIVTYSCIYRICPMPIFMYLCTYEIKEYSSNHLIILD